MPKDIADDLGGTLVNKAAVDAGEKDTFTFFDLATGEAEWRVPASERLRVSCDRLRRLMLTGLNVQWGKTVVHMSSVDVGITVTYSDGTTAMGSLVVGCDGAHSQIRKLCHPDEYHNDPLPIRFIGAGPRYSVSTAEGMRKLDPFFLQDSSPKTDAYLWFSFLDMPGDPDTVQPETQRLEDDEMRRCSDYDPMAISTRLSGTRETYRDAANKFRETGDDVDPGRELRRAIQKHRSRNPAR